MDYIDQANGHAVVGMTLGELVCCLSDQCRCVLQRGCGAAQLQRVLHTSKHKFSFFNILQKQIS